MSAPFFGVTWQMLGVSCLLERIGGAQLSISNTHKITQDAITGVVLLSSSGRRRWIASWYKERLSDWDFWFCFRSIWRADKAKIE